MACSLGELQYHGDAAVAYKELVAPPLLALFIFVSLVESEKYGQLREACLVLSRVLLSASLTIKLTLVWLNSIGYEQIILIFRLSNDGNGKSMEIRL